MPPAAASLIKLVSCWSNLRTAVTAGLVAGWGRSSARMTGTRKAIQPDGSCGQKTKDGGSSRFTNMSFQQNGRFSVASVKSGPSKPGRRSARTSRARAEWGRSSGPGSESFADNEFFKCSCQGLLVVNPKLGAPNSGTLANRTIARLPFLGMGGPRTSRHRTAR
jgi:hypothetical protein